MLYFIVINPHLEPNQVISNSAESPQFPFALPTLMETGPMTNHKVDEDRNSE